MEHFGDNIISFLKKAGTKLEELQVQAALGKAELRDTFEDVKKESHEQYQRLKSQVNAEIDKNSEKWQHLKAKLEHLEVQLALGKAETKDMLEEQKKNLKQAIQDVKGLIQKD